MIRNLPVVERHFIHVPVVVASTGYPVENGGRSRHITIEFERVRHDTRSDIHHTHPRITSTEHHVTLPHGCRAVDVIARLELSRLPARLVVEGVHTTVITPYEQLVINEIRRTRNLPQRLIFPERLHGLGCKFPKLLDAECRHVPVYATDEESRVHRRERSLDVRAEVVATTRIPL